MHLKELFHSAAVVACLTAIVGCGDSANPATFPVTGTVIQSGTPVEGATVTFLAADDTGQSAVGVTDSSGKYTLTTFESNDGALPGDYKVRLFKYDGPQEAETPAAAGSGEMVEMGAGYTAPGAASSGSQEPQNLLPAKYAKASATPLQFSVTEDDNVYDIELDAN